MEPPGPSPVAVASSSFWPSVLPEGCRKGRQLQEPGAAVVQDGVSLPSRISNSPGMGVALSQPKGKTCPQCSGFLAALSRQRHKGLAMCRCPCPACRGFVLLLLGWVAAAVGKP